MFLDGEINDNTTIGNTTRLLKLLERIIFIGIKFIKI